MTDRTFAVRAGYVEKTAFRRFLFFYEDFCCRACREIKCVRTYAAHLCRFFIPWERERKFGRQSNTVSFAPAPGDLSQNETIIPRIRQSRLPFFGQAVIIKLSQKGSSLHSRGNVA